MQSVTGWFFLPPLQPVTVNNFNPLFYTVMGFWFLILIWRLWPKEVSDYRV